MKQKTTNQQTKVTTPLSQKFPSPFGEGLGVRPGAGEGPINPKDLDLHPCFAHLDLWYNVRDYEACRQVRFYTHAKRNDRYGHRKGELYEIPTYEKDPHATDRKRGISPNVKPQWRRYIVIHHKGKSVTLLCSHLVFKIGWTFPNPDPRHNVIDHIDKVTTNDRRNNLRIWSQQENSNTPESREARLNNFMKGRYVSRGLCNAKRHEIKAHRLRVLKLTGHMPSLEDAMRDLGLKEGGAQ